MKIEFPYDKISAFYPYRSARAFSDLYLKDENNELWDAIRERLEEDGYKIDNHICFTINNINYMWSDCQLYIGGKLTVSRW